MRLVGSAFHWEQGMVVEVDVMDEDVTYGKIVGQADYQHLSGCEVILWDDEHHPRHLTFERWGAVLP